MKNETATARAPEGPSFELVATDRLVESPLNPRKTFAKLDELAASLRQVGMIVPIVARPGSGTSLEVIAGARRLRAARKAKLERVPVVVREMSDEMVIDSMLTENLQREDVHPLEEADIFRKLVDGDSRRQIRSRSAAEVAGRIGKSEAFVHQRLRLCSLTEKVRKLFFEGEFPLSVALVLARVASPKLQEEAAKEVAADARRDGEPPSAERVRHMVERSYMTRLAQAPFDLGDAALDPKAGACTTCPKRSGNQTAMFAEGTGAADVCTDVPCYRRKVDAEWERRTEAAAKTGGRVKAMADAESHKKLYLYDHAASLDSRSGLVDLEDRPWKFAEGKKTWRQLMGKEGTAAASMTLARDRSGGIHELVREVDAVKAYRQSPAGKKEAEARKRSGDDDDEHKRRQEKFREEQRVAGLANARAMAELVVKVEAGPNRDAEVLGLVLEGLLDVAWAEVTNGVAARRGMLPEGKAKRVDSSTVLRKAAADMTLRQRWGLLLEVVIERGLNSYGAAGKGDVLHEACKVLGVPLAEIVKEEKAKAAAARKEKAARAKGKKTAKAGPADDGGEDQP